MPESRVYITARRQARLANRSTDYDLVVGLIEPRSKVLDLGCGSGELLERLVREKKVQGWGLDIDPELVIECVAKG